jgi:hypothetical protein
LWEGKKHTCKEDIQTGIDYFLIGANTSPKEVEKNSIGVERNPNGIGF